MGIVIGICVFTITIATVLYLLWAGGTLDRIAEQDADIKKGGDGVATNAKVILEGRPSLFEDLVHCRAVMCAEKAKSTTLTSKVSSHLPSPALFKSNYLRFQTYHVTYSVHVPGRPNAAPEAFTKACCSQIPPFFASKIPETLKNHSRSYGRVYTTIATKGTKEFDEMEDVYKTYPTATVGSSIIVIPYLKGDKKCEEIADDFARNTSGMPFEGNTSYDPSSLWGFHPTFGGPFLTAGKAEESGLFSTSPDSCLFLCLDNVTRKCVGAIKLSNDRPEHLTVRFECGLWSPAYRQKIQEVEAGFLVLGKVFSMGYRRVEFDCDKDDSESRKMATRLGFAPEGEKIKDVLIEVDEETVMSRSSYTFAMLNSDWNGESGARDHLFGKIYGKGALKTDRTKRKEDDEDDQEIRLALEAKARKEKSETKEKKDEPKLVKEGKEGKK